MSIPIVEKDPNYKISVKANGNVTVHLDIFCGILNDIDHRHALSLIRPLKNWLEENATAPYLIDVMSTDSTYPVMMMSFIFNIQFDDERDKLLFLMRWK